MDETESLEIDCTFCGEPRRPIVVGPGFRVTPELEMAISGCASCIEYAVREFEITSYTPDTSAAVPEDAMVCAWCSSPHVHRDKMLRCCAIFRHPDGQMERVVHDQF